jgi:hypothetical protein
LIEQHDALARPANRFDGAQCRFSVSPMRRVLRATDVSF